MGQKRGLVVASSTFFEKSRDFFSKLDAETHALGPDPRQYPRPGEVQQPMPWPRRFSLNFLN